MRRRDAVQKLKKILQEWDGCMMDTKATKQILERIEKDIGMLPPYSSKLTTSDGCKGLSPNGFNWDE